MAHGLSPLIKREIECNSTKPRNSTEANHTNHTNSATVTPNTKMGSRRIFTPQFKLQVLDSYRNDSDCKGNQRATARKYGIHRRQIQKWLQCESNLRSSVLNSGINNGGKNNCNNNNNNNNNINNNNIINNTINNPTTPTSHSTEVASVVSLDTTRHSVALSGHNCNNSTTGSMGFVSPVHSHVSDNVSVSFAHESSASLPNSPVPTLTNQKHELNVVVCDISPISAGGVGGGGVYDFATIKQEQQFYDNYYMAAPLTSYNHNYDYQQQNPHHHHHHHHDHHNMQQQDHQHCPPENHEMSLSNYDYSDVMEATEAPIDLSLHHRRRNEAIPRVPSESQQIISAHNCSNNCSNNNNISLNDEQPHLTDLSSSPPIDLSCRKRKLSSNVSADPGIKINTSCGGSGNVSADGGGSPSKVIKLFKPYLDHAEDDINDEIEVKKKPHDTHDPIIWSNHPCSPELYENHNIYSYEYNCYPSPTYPAASAFYDYGSNYWCHRRGSPVSSSTGAYDRAASISSSYSTNSESSDLTTCTSYRQQRHYYSIDFKLQAIDSYYHDSTCRGNQRAVASKYNIHRRQIQKWLQQEEDLRQRPTMVR